MGVGFVPGPLGSDNEVAQREKLGDSPSFGGEVEPLPGPLGNDAVELSDEPTCEEGIAKYDVSNVDDKTASANGKGATLADLKKDLDAKLPSSTPGLSYWGKGGARKMGTSAFQPPKSQTFKLEVRAEFFLNLPVWDDYANATAGAKAEWDRFLKQLRTHEMQHVAEAKTWLDKIIEQVKGQTKSESSKTIKDRAADMKTAQTTLDTNTKHGADINAVLDTTKV